ncbi:MAG: hypothetical protein RH948_16475 [Cyclobacteriaceae bacterium]
MWLGMLEHHIQYTFKVVGFALGVYGFADGPYGSAQAVYGFALGVDWMYPPCGWKCWSTTHNTPLVWLALHSGWLAFLAGKGEG